ncbi:hypothetical protein Stsp01_06410 [Streptomyces sp. NBRC 13847]|uniref:hypothetical protein n=1 Tax=Streptomyces TaxID=1883 RepID=UPI0024A2B5CA|nr:hypothetical protein [Streptomyces sp. NBRC 13847]GLW13898.1 hypothetical protein Stsp01_06410 [Streptomyces sp. NBRC 13847]
MSHERLRIAAATTMAAVAIGVAAPAATAATMSPSGLPAAQEVQVTESLAALLESKAPEARAFLSLFSADEIAEFKRAADTAPSKSGPQALAAPNWGKIWSALKKIGGFTKAVGGKYATFKKWVDSRPWYIKYLIKGLSPGLTLYDIWWHFNH